EWPWPGSESGWCIPVQERPSGLREKGPDFQNSLNIPGAPYGTQISTRAHGRITVETIKRHEIDALPAGVKISLLEAVALQRCHGLCEKHVRHAVIGTLGGGGDGSKAAMTGQLTMTPSI